MTLIGALVFLPALGTTGLIDETPPLVHWLMAFFHAFSKVLIQLQIPLLAFVALVLLPGWEVGDEHRGAPLRNLAAIVCQESNPGEPLAMVGMLKPSLHFYAQRFVIYEGRSTRGLLNAENRLRQEHRRALRPTNLMQQLTLLLLIDLETATLPHWCGLFSETLAAADSYRLVRIDRKELQRRAREL